MYLKQIENAEKYNTKNTEKIIGEAVCLGASFVQYLIAFVRFAKAVKKETGTYHFTLAFLSQMPTEEDQIERR